VIWLLALQLSVPPQQQHYDNAEADLAKMQFSQAQKKSIQHCTSIQILCPH
jgi:hypothetical protein